MLRKLLLFLVFIPVYLIGQVTISPFPFEVNQSITITVNLNQSQCNSIPISTNKVYMHAGIGTDTNPWGYSVIGNWGQDNGIGLMTNQGNGLWSITLTPSTYFNLNTSQQNTATKMGLVFRNASGSQEMKLPNGTNCQDFIYNVGSFQVTLLSHTANASHLINSGSDVSIVAQNTGGNANYSLTANNSPLNCATTATNFFSCTDANVTTNRNYTLSATIGSTTITKQFNVVVIPNVASETMSPGLEDGINYFTTDPTKVTLVLNAPFKDFVYVAGNFNNWQPNDNHLMKKDPATGKFWIELTNLTPGTDYAYQYWVCDNTNRPANSPAIVKTADPFSTLVLSPFDDSEIINLGVYPGLPSYNLIAPGQEREVTYFKTGETPYTWSSTSQNFIKPSKKDLIIYEVLVRDFDTNRTYQNLINKINYFKNLGVNAIQLMPVMEFEGNESWGYNTSFHMALDKRYGPPNKLKEFVDLCHQNGIAVILDLALNHVFGRSPLVRMWMQDADNNGWGDAVSTTTENPYINQFAKHSYSVGSDLNHFNEPNNLTNTYSIRTLKHWIQEYKVDGFRWDLTKGFTNQCSSGDDACTNGYRSDRVAKMKWYADKQWELDPTSYVIFEHLGVGGSATEELEWATYNAAGNTKGVMYWKKLTDNYANLLKGNFTDVSGVTNANNRCIGYAESHDEERILYKAINEAGQTQNNLTKALKRMQALGSVFFLVPGPKMIWHFSELGWNDSLWQCTNGTVSFSNPDCKLDTKPQPQWTSAWQNNTQRQDVYVTFSKLIKLRTTESVFENGQHEWDITTTGRPRLKVWTSTTPQSNLSYVVALTNFSDSDFAPTVGFPYTGTWYNLMDNTSLNVTNVNMQITIEAGGFRVYGNQPNTLLSTNDFEFSNKIVLYPNPTKNSFYLSQDVAQVEIYTISGQLVKTYNSVIAQNEIPIEFLENGIYFVKIKTSDGLVETKKLIKE